MGTIGKDFRFKIIKNFLSKEEITLFQKYCEIKHRTNKNSFDWKYSNVAATFFYGEAILDALMVEKTSLMERESGLKLLPTYSFFRSYIKGAILDKHTDRPACEISCTVNVGGDTDWPIYMDGTPLHLKPGDAAMYLGQDIVHWREALKGDHQFQFFLHWVDANGKNTDQYMDGRLYWGTPSPKAPRRNKPYDPEENGN